MRDDGNKHRVRARSDGPLTVTLFAPCSLIINSYIPQISDRERLGTRQVSLICCRAVRSFQIKKDQDTHEIRYSFVSKYIASAELKPSLIPNKAWFPTGKAALSCGHLIFSRRSAFSVKCHDLASSEGSFFTLMLFQRSIEERY